MSSDETDEDLPSAEECGKLCESFAEITGTDTACAQFYLQDRKWSLESSVNDFFEDKLGKSVTNAIEDRSVGKSQSVTVTTTTASYGLQKKKSGGNVTESSQAGLVPNTNSAKEEPCKELKFITWNIDGLNEKNLKLRTKAVCKRIIHGQADIVFLQEIIPESAAYLITHLSDYDCAFGNEMGYFVGTFLKKKTVKFLDSEVIDFPSTRMMRNILRVNARVGSVPLCLMNSHLESTVEGAEERKSQLRSALQQIVSAPDDYTVLFAGDMNLRDKELTEIGGLPAGVEDVWVMCGSRKECSYTWDMTRNDNLMYNSRFKPRCRFDRIYLRGSSPSKLSPKFFGLIGLERLLPHRCFPSDHWGILAHFDIV